MRGVVNASGLPVHFVSGPATDPALAYEINIHNSGAVATRSDNWHDFFNALVWLGWPHTKAALNALHIRAGVTAVRSRLRDTLTLLDESGVVVACAEPALWDNLTRADWHTLFVLQRAKVRAAMRFYLIGHALHEKALAPYPSMTGKCVQITVTEDFFALDTMQQRTQLDAMLAQQLLAAPPQTPAQFPPLPLLGIPGVTPASEHPDFYANTRIFRPPRMII
ncbi:hypothetical protein TPL01_03790 [Sulfuriferula plumbiphila]|uniref:DUF3025 domain-containing protein n=1 Tax=Sulfuriferula plumbiphila TaxID=171865 RepID=A0A512L4W5_9PROT|nr:DUF3025 domain-containing protein [Sulfuriferula plumbiphila]BBP05462.1 hypothetical protein SFPGR_28840 [Sulfuriferula plumbiphila]GEP29241.1 hypothetical protein TPL01_03790 [Sulfuriferula plumbiphila]